jgi:rfaE bifunctional protein kinase chain/domain
LSTFDQNRLAAVRVLVVGDVMLDRYWFGDVQRISPEAPVPIVNVASRQERPGGAANVACNVTALGAACTLLSVVGDDEAGHSLRAALSSSAIEQRLHVDADADTTVKLRVMSRNQQLIRLDFETRPNHEILERCLEDFDSCLARCDIVVLSDYAKGGLTHITRMMDRARAAGRPVVVDPKGRDFGRYRGAALLTPNRREFDEVVGVSESETELDAKAFAMLDELGIERMLLTRSEHGMTLYGADGSRHHCDARRREVFDVTGAGDTVVAVMATMLAGGVEPAQAMRLANAAAGIVVGRLGTAVVGADELQRAAAED